MSVKSLDDARAWVHEFAKWYNTEHRHSRIKFVTPEQRHNGEDKAILTKRRQLYKKAQQKHPNRCSKDTRNWDEIGKVELNPENKKEAA